MGEETVSDVMEEEGPLNFASETSPRTVRENAVWERNRVRAAVIRSGCIEEDNRLAQPGVVWCFKAFSW